MTRKTEKPNPRNKVNKQSSGWRANDQWLMVLSPPFELLSSIIWRFHLFTIYLHDKRTESETQTQFPKESKTGFSIQDLCHRKS